MGWRKKAAKPHASELERFAGQAEALILAMPELERRRVLEAVEVMARAGAELRALPDDVVELLSKMAFKFMLDLNTPSLRRKPSAAELVDQLVRGAPTLLGPHAAALKRLTTDAA